ncbi:MAG: DUF348 domain-containing protein [Anaerolineae bacterium]|nr:DUF348 domain-containing protein [Anaerolineae bacterium]
MPDRKLPRLPLPGEQPGTIYRPRARRSTPPSQMGWFWPVLPYAFGLAALLATGWVWLATGTPVTVVVNGSPVEVRNHRPRVAGMVRAAGVRLDRTLYIDPPPDSPVSSAMVITVAEQRPVTVHVDGDTRRMELPGADASQIPGLLAITMGPGDTLRVDRAVRPGPAEIARDPALAHVPAIPREVSVRRAYILSITEYTSPGAAPVHSTVPGSAPTVGVALEAAGYRLYEGDRVTPPPDTSLDAISPGETVIVEIRRGTPVSIAADGQTRALRTRASTVADALAELGLAPSGGDYLIPPPETPLSPGLTIRLVRVRIEPTIEEEEIPYTTRYIPDPMMELDQLRLVAPGLPGLRRREIAVRYEDGAMVNSVPRGEWIEREPTPEVIAYGTRIVLHTAQTPGGPVAYWRRLRVLATSYSPLTAGHKQPGDPFFGLSGTGTPVVRGIVATDPRVIPLYTRMFVPGYGYGQALDVGGAVKGMRIDLGYDDANLVLWNNWIEIYLLPPVPSPDQMVWVLPEAQARPADE